MKKMSVVKKSILTAVCIALCVVLPQAFHAVGASSGQIFLPMHIPVLLCGLICGAPYGLLCGLAGPLLSSLMTAMPSAPALPGMMVECAAYGFAAGLVMRLLHTKSTYADLYLSLLAAMLFGRVISGVTKALIFSAGEYTIAAWVASSFVTALPGIIIQLILLPSIVFALMKAKLIPQRYIPKT